MGIKDAATIIKMEYIITHHPSTNAQLQSQLSTAYGKPFQMTVAQVDSVFTTIAATHINKVKTATQLPLSDEFIALTSLSFNGMFGSELKAAIIDYSDPSMARAEAWYQIRYIHLPDQNVSRRYSEASIFGLYNDQTGVVSKSEAIGIYKMYTHHYTKLENSTIGMNAYDIDKVKAITASNGDLNSIKSQIPGFENYSTHVIGEELTRAAQAIETAYLKPYGLTLGEVNPLNIQVSYTGFANLTGENTTTHTGYIHDLLIGDSQANQLTGNAGNDILIGGGGGDTLIGGVGNDIYFVDNIADVVTETSILATEIDKVFSSVTYTLGENVENLTLTGTIAISGIGNALNNVLTGNAAANVLTGGAGNDTYFASIGDTITENTGQGTDTVKINDNLIISADFKNVEKLVINDTRATPLTVKLNQLTDLTFSSKADKVTLHLNMPQTAPINIHMGDGSDVISLRPSMSSIDSTVYPAVISIVACNDSLKFFDFAIGDKIDLREFNIPKSHSVKLVDTSGGDGYYLQHNLAAGTSAWNIMQVGFGHAYTRVVITGIPDTFTDSSFIFAA